MSYQDDIDTLNQTLNTAMNYQAQQASIALAENDLEFGKEAFNQQMGLANEQFDWNKKVADRNYEFQKTQWEYQKELNNLAMQREDNAYSRAVQDLKNAGLSPLMLSSGAGSQALSSGNAPQYDVNGVNTAYGAKQDALERRRQQLNANRQFRFEQKQANRQLALQSASMALQVEKQAQELVSSHYDNKLKRAQYDSVTKETAYNEAHGWRNQNIESAVIALAEYIYQHRNTESMKQAREEVNKQIKEVAGDLGLTKEGRDSVVQVSESKFHQGQKPMEYLSSMKNALDVYNDVSKGRSAEHKDVQKIWNSSPQVRDMFNYNYNEFYKACQSPKFIKSYIME